MKNKKSYILFSLLMGSILCQNVEAQIIEIVENLNISTGSHVYCTPGTLISPSVSSSPVVLSGTSQVDYIAGNEVQLLDGFSSHPNGAGYFHASNPTNYSVSMEPQNGQVPEFEKVEYSLVLPPQIRQDIADFVTNGTGLNPFDPDQISVEATFTSPSNATTKIYGFYYQNFEYGIPIGFPPVYTPSLPNDRDTRWSEVGDGLFKVRFSPDEIGTWTCNIVVKFPSSPGNEYNFCDLDFVCTASSNKGYVEVGNNGYLKFGKTDETFFPIGAYMGWPNFRPNSTNDNYDYYPSTDPNARGRAVRPVEYDDYMQSLETVKNSGGNYVRMIIAPQAWAVEWEELGNYSKRQAHAWELDRVIQWAEDNDVYLNIAMNHGVVLMDFDVSNAVDEHGENWESNPYRTIISPPGDATRFYTENSAKEQYKKYLRYFVSRWGYSTHIAKLEMGNEMSSGGYYVDSTNNYCFIYNPYRQKMRNVNCPNVTVPGFQYQPDPTSLPDSDGFQALLPSSVTNNTMAKDYQYWNNTMVGFIKNDLAAKQITSVSYGIHSSDFPQTDDLTNLDQNISTIAVHSYLTELNGNLLRAQTVKDNKNRFLQKPFMFEELEHGSFFSPGPNDHNDVDMHNSSWAMCFTGAFGTTPVIVPGWPGRPVTDSTEIFFLRNIPAISSFFNGVDFEQFDYIASALPSGPSDVSLSGSFLNQQSLEKFILSADEQAMGWIHLRRWYWAAADNPNNVCQYEQGGLHYYHVLDLGLGATPPAVSNQNLTINSLNAGDYVIDWYDTRVPNFICHTDSVSTHPVPPPNGPPILTVPIPILEAPIDPNCIECRPDIAFKIRPANGLPFRSAHISDPTSSPIAVLNVQPNPNYGEFTITIESPYNANPNLYMIDLWGRVLYTQSISIQEGRTQIPMVKTELPAGIYFIKIDGFDEQVKLIVSR